MKIFKYPLEIARIVSIDLPIFHTIVHVGLDPSGLPCIWAIVDPARPSVSTFFLVVGTRHEMPEEYGEHVGSFKQGPFMWHVFYAV